MGSPKGERRPLPRRTMSKFCIFSNDGAKESWRNKNMMWAATVAAVVQLRSFVLFQKNDPGDGFEEAT